jgi:hypothetical protein
MSDIFEKRSNSELNTLARTKDFADDMKKYQHDDYFITFTALEKVGINPKSDYDFTPLGVYAYPLGNETIQQQIGADNIPFAGDARWANVLRITASEEEVLDVRTYTLEHYERDMKLIRSMLLEVFDETVEKANAFYVACKVIPPSTQRPVEMFWKRVRASANAIALKRKSPRVTLGEITTAMTTHKWVTRPHATLYFNKLLRGIGYRVVIDHGIGMIYSGEPIQTVFLDPLAFKTVERRQNGNWADKKQMEINTPRHILTAIRRQWLDSMDALTVLTALVDGKDWYGKRVFVRPGKRPKEAEVIAMLRFLREYGEPLGRITHCTARWKPVISMSERVQREVYQLFIEKADPLDRHDIMYFGFEGDFIDWSRHT